MTEKITAKKIKEEARQLVAKEKIEAARKRLVELYRRKSQAEDVVRSIDKEIEMAEAEIDAEL